jgi:hypothetical protein
MPGSVYLRDLSEAKEAYIVRATINGTTIRSVSEDTPSAIRITTYAPIPLELAITLKHR